MFLSAEKSSSISIARRVMSSAGWGAVSHSNQQMRLEGKAQLNAVSLVLKGGGSSLVIKK
jgi:hypothetical protein